MLLGTDRAGHSRSGGHETFVRCTVECPEEDDNNGASDARTNPGIGRSQKRRADNSCDGRVRIGAGAQQPSARSRMTPRKIRGCLSRAMHPLLMATDPHDR